MAELRSSQSFVPLDHPDRARTAKTKAFFAYWQGLQAAGRPTRASLDPVEMRSFLGNLMTGDIEPHPFRVHYQLVGTIIAAYSRLDFTHRYLDELVYTGRDDVDWEICYRHVHATKAPVVGTCHLHTLDDRVIGSYEYAIVPLWRGEDPAGSFVGIEVYDDIISNRIPDWSRVTLKGS
jgi:hypothetical protein